MGLETFLLAGALLTATPDTTYVQERTQDVRTYVEMQGKHISTNSRPDIIYRGDETFMSFDDCRAVFFPIKGREYAVISCNKFSNDPELPLHDQPSLLFYTDYGGGLAIFFDVGANGAGSFCYTDQPFSPRVALRLCDAIQQQVLKHFSPNKVHKKPSRNNLRTT